MSVPLIGLFRIDNPSDAKWLQTALHKGTSKDRANAGALLVQSNPLPNLTALETLVGLAKVSNKTSAMAVGKSDIFYSFRYFINQFVQHRCYYRIIYECSVTTK